MEHEFIIPPVEQDPNRGERGLTPSSCVPSRSVFSFGENVGWFRSYLWRPCLAFTPDGKLLAFGRIDNTIKLVKVATGQEVRTFTGHGYGVSGRVNTVAFSPDGGAGL
jgi:WD40 repeat protein